MPLPDPVFVAAQGVLQLRDLLPPSPAQDDAFIAAVSPEFSEVVSRQVPPPGVPPLVPHLTLASTSAHLAVSAAQADFQVRFYGDYAHDLERALDYVEQKMRAILRGFDAIGGTPATVGLISTLRYSIAPTETPTAVGHILATHVRSDVEAGVVQDALARVAVRVRDKYFVTLTVSNYEERVMERPIMPGVPVRLQPWDGRVRDTGLELAIDINNYLEARNLGRESVVTENGLGAMTSMLKTTATGVGPAFAESGTLSMNDLEVAAAI